VDAVGIEPVGKAHKTFEWHVSPAAVQEHEDLCTEEADNLRHHQQNYRKQGDSDKKERRAPRTAQIQDVAQTDMGQYGLLHNRDAR